MSGLDPIQEASRDQFGRQAARYGHGHILRQTEDLEAALPWLEAQPGQTLLDVACGAGHTGLFFARRGLRVTLSDLTASMLDQARELLVGQEAAFREHPAESMPWPDAAFEFVTCRVAAHHFSSPVDFMKESARVLKPGGRLCVIDGAVEDGFPTAAEWLNRIEKWRDPSHGRFLTPSEWRGLCHAANLEIVGVKLLPLLQPDLEWYFETAGTPPENRQKVLQSIADAPEEAVELFKLRHEPGQPVQWWWQRLLVVARKPM